MKRSKSLINSSYDGSQCMDIERCQDELLKSRKRYNKLNQKYLELKVEYNKLEKDYRYNVRIMESIIKESNIAALSEFLEDPKFNNTNTTNEKEKEKEKENNNEIIKENSLSKTTIKILKEKSIYERLKLEIMNLRDELKTKEDTIDDLKNSAKATKFRELDNKFALMYQELNTVKARNQVLETMQADYVNSKNQIIFLLKQIDLYKKDNKKLKELYEKILFDYQNITKQKEEMENSKNLYEDRIKALINKNNSLKIKLEDLRIKNIAYYEEIDKYKNLNQSNIDKLLLRKEKEISQYRGQITQLKMEIGTLQKRADERTKNSINSATVTGFKKIKPIYQNKKDNIKELRKTDSDFFVTKPKTIFGNEKKIVINSKIMKKNNDENKFDKKISKIKIKDNKEDSSSIKVENKQENSDILNNYYDKKIPNIKGGKNMNDKKTTANEEDINIEYKKEDTIDKDEKQQKEENDETNKENNISKELNEDSKKYENNNNEKSIKSQNEEKELENEGSDEIKKIDEDKDKSQEKENIINNKEKSEDNKNENISNEGIKGKYNEEEIIVNMSNDKEDKINKDKKNESSYGYNDFESNFDKQNTLKENNNSNINNNLESELKNNTNDINVQSIEPKNEPEEKNNLEENIDNKLKESNALDFEQKNESKENNDLSKENNIKKDEEEKKEDDAGEEEEYKFSKNDGLIEGNI